MLNKMMNPSLTAAVRGQIMMAQKRTNLNYNHRIVCSAPRVRIPFAEKVFWGVFIASTIVSVPAYILVHHRSYMGEEE